MMIGVKDKQLGREAVLTDYSRRKLLTYADSFQELASSLSPKYVEGGEDRQEILERKLLWEKQQMLCENMGEVSRILSQMADEVFQMVTLPQRYRKRIIQALRTEKIYVTDIFHLRTSQQRDHNRTATLGVRMHCERAGGYTAKEVADILSVLMDSRLTPAVTSPYHVDKEEKYFFFVEEPMFLVLPGYAKAVRENEQISGDNYSIIESNKGEMTILLSDGMGCGEKACKDSEKVLDLMEKLLEAGYDMTTAIHLLNNSLAVQEKDQNMSTLDVCHIDLYDGMCEFRKFGAAATFLKSNTYVEQISMNTLPLGIFQNQESETVSRELIENDYIIMVTDGVTDALAAGGYEDMLCSYLEDMEESNPGEMARRILQLALRLGGGHVMDDMTVVVLGVFSSR